MAQQKQTKEQKEKEFREAVEQLLGFPLMEWQKPILEMIRQDSIAGRPINFELIVRPKEIR